MNTKATKIERALLSVSDKTGIVELATLLHDLGAKIISTGGTARTLQQAKIPVIPVEEYTNFPEMMDGRVKTLHPKIAGGILGLRDRHARDGQTHAIHWIDFVVCNLYPFAETIANRQNSFEEAIEQIDIGGPTMVRAAAKNFGWTTILTHPEDYQGIMESLQTTQTIPFALRKTCPYCPL